MGVANSSEVIVSIKISKDEYLKWYQGTVKSVYTIAVDGRSISFPANILRPFVAHDGISGVFAITFDKENKFKDIQRYQW